jgi:hypothetical protein
MPRALQELEHQDLHPVADGAQCSAHGSGGLALSGASVNYDQSLANVAHDELRIVNGSGIRSVRYPSLISAVGDPTPP